MRTSASTRRAGGGRTYGQPHPDQPVIHHCLHCHQSLRQTDPSNSAMPSLALPPPCSTNYRNPAKREGQVSNNTLLVLGQFLDREVRGYVRTSGVDELSQSFLFGAKVAGAILQLLELKADDPGTDTGAYVPKFPLTYYFGDDPSNPVRLRPFDPNNPSAGDQVQRPYHAPYYGETARRFAVTMDHKMAPPPVVPADVAGTYQGTGKAEYDDAAQDVIRMGGRIDLPTTKRPEDRSVAGLFWAYDGTTLIGTPPRLYNQMVRRIAYDHRRKDPSSKVPDIANDANTADIVRLFALVNVASADAGIICWREKYRYELWRPLPGIRNDPHHPLPTWGVFGAPETNSNRQPFKPPFPAYPSGHATFGAACFHMVQLFYGVRDGTATKESAAPKNHNVDQITMDNKQDQTDPAKQQSEQSSQPVLDDNDDKRKKTNPKVNVTIGENDGIQFNFISDELNNISRDLYQPWIPTRRIEDQDGHVRTRVLRKFSSLWHAIWENALSRVWLGVHWRYDAFDAEKMVYKHVNVTTITNTNSGKKEESMVAVSELEADGSTKYKPVSDAEGQFFNENREVIGGVPLGSRIAQDIFGNDLSSPPESVQPK